MPISFSSFAKWLASVFNPPYQLTLSDKFISEKSGDVIYVFKQYGMHEYVQVTYGDILNSSDLLNAINPINLMDIHLEEYLRKAQSNEIRVREVLRSGRYKLSRGDLTQEYSGEYIVSNVDMFENMSASDMCQIALATGFTRGRTVSKEIQETIAMLREEELQQSKRAPVLELFRSSK
ncbi:hypothetical protein ACI2UY_22590 [Ralstonia nicotianae]